MGGSSPEKAPENRQQLQIDTTKNRWKTLIGQPLLPSSFGKLRTVVIRFRYRISSAAAAPLLTIGRRDHDWLIGVAAHAAATLAPIFQARFPEICPEFLDPTSQHPT
jgi:hypothetical protein